MTGRACEENKSPTVQIVAHLLKAFIHITLYQFDTHKAGQVIFVLDGRVRYTHIAVHSRTEYHTAGFQNKRGNGGKRTAGCGLLPQGIVLTPNGKHGWVRTQLTMLE